MFIYIYLVVLQDNFSPNMLHPTAEIKQEEDGEPYGVFT